MAQVTNADFKHATLSMTEDGGWELEEDDVNEAEVSNVNVQFELDRSYGDASFGMDFARLDGAEGVANVFTNATAVRVELHFSRTNISEPTSTGQGNTVLEGVIKKTIEEMKGAAFEWDHAVNMYLVVTDHVAGEIKEEGLDLRSSSMQEVVDRTTGNRGTWYLVHVFKP